jgi:molybdopterin-containing oxidoreductase family membrane subunit
MNLAASPGRAPPGARSLALAAVLLGLVALGVLGYAQQRLHGDIATGLRTIGQGGAAWGLYIVFDIFFVGLAFGGIAFTSIVRLFHLRDLRPLSRMAQVLTLVSLAMAGLCVLADLGRPLHGMTNFPRYARTMSPFFGTFSLVACTGSLATFVYLWLDGRADAAGCAARGGPLGRLYRLWAFGWQGTASERWRHRRSSFWLSLALLPLLVVAYSTLGLVFGIQGGRPGWFSALQAPGLLVLAAISTAGILIVIAAVVRSAPAHAGKIRDQVFYWLSNTLWILTLVYVYILVVEELTRRYAALEAETRVARAVVTGEYALAFWAMVGGFVVPAAVLFAQFVRRRVSIGLSVTCALVLNTATWIKRVLVVVPSQTHGMLLPYATGHYSPTWVELAVITGLLSLGTLSYLAFAWFFPIVPGDLGPSDRPGPEEREQGVRMVLRAAVFYVTLLLGVALATTGFLLCARVGNEPWQDPPVPLSPVIFVVGMLLVFYSAAAYELLPPARPARPAA